MTKKLFNCILTTCLLFSSLNLPVFAETTNTPQTTTIKSVVKKSPESHFLDGEACLKAANIACAKMSAALIPNVSAYAKILEGALAYQQNQIDRTLMLLLPLQTDNNLIVPAKILLHQTLAQAFESFGDTQQALQHLILVDASLNMGQTPDAAIDTAKNHESIWRIIKPLNQAELIALRGNNTDTIFQGWIDLALAKNKADNNSIANWRILYTDHPALGYADNLANSSVTATPAKNNLALSGPIAIMLPAQSDVDTEKLEAFKLGLETALNLAGITKPIEVYYQELGQQDAAKTYTQAMTDGSDYFILPMLNEANPNSYFEKISGKLALHIGPALNDEANAIFKFASKNSMQHITVVATQHEASQQMLVNLQKTWAQSSEDSSSAMHVIVLAADVLAQPGKLLDLKSQIAANVHDMVVLAMPVADVVKIRPYLDISTPTITFSSIHDIAYENDSLKLLNALRFVDMPFLLASNQTVSDYQHATANLNNKTLLRWFALGVDSLSLLAIGSEKFNQAVLMQGLAGDYSITESGSIDRALISARFNQSGVIAD